MKKCPNCGEQVPHLANGCALEALVGVVADRGTKTKEELEALWVAVDVDALWNDLGALVNRLEDGEYCAK